MANEISNIRGASSKKLLGRSDERGASMVEYALIAALIALLGAAAVPSMGAQLNKKFCAAGTELGGDSMAGASNGGDDPCGVELATLPED